jgi:photosystem II stability/assembly factor-like uncharacterized protein
MCISLHLQAQQESVPRELQPVSEELPVWTEVGPLEVPLHISTGVKEGVGRIDCIGFHPADTNIVYVGSPGGGLWRTTDRFRSWEALSDSLPFIGIADMALDPADPERIFVATGDKDTRMLPSAGIYFSEDGGKSWKATGFSRPEGDPDLVIHRLVMSPLRPDTMLAATSQGILYTGDAWTTFETVAAGYFRDLEWHPSDPLTVYAATYNPAGNAVFYRSTDGGRNFLPAMEGISEPGSISRMEIEVSPASPGRVYLLNVRSGVEDLHSFCLSEDMGDSWSVRNDGSTNILAFACNGGSGIGEGNTQLAFAVSPEDGDVIFSGSLFMWKSMDGGITWSVVSGWCGGDVPYVRPHHHAMEFGPAGAVFTGSGGGIFGSWDGGQSWEKISSDLRVMDIYGFGVVSGAEPDTAPVVYAGTRDNGILLLRDEEWLFLKDGSGTDCITDNYDPDRVFFTRPDGSISRNLDWGQQSVKITPDMGTGGEFRIPLVQHPQYPDILFAAYDRVVRTQDAGESWLPLEDPGLNGHAIRSLALSGLKPNAIYAASASDLSLSRDEGQQWQVISRDIPLEPGERDFSAVICSPEDPHKIWLANMGWEEGLQLFHSPDGGQSWLDQSAGLPPVPVYDLLYEPGSPAIIYAATLQGIWYRNRYMDRWTRYGTGLPNTRVTDLEWDADRQLLLASTLGRGIWEIPPSGSLENLPNPSFKASTHVVCGGSTVAFTTSAAGQVRWDFGPGSDPATADGPGPHMVSFGKGASGNISLVLDDSITETRYGFIESLTEIRVALFPAEACTVEPVELTASGAGSYAWSPEEFLSATEGENVVASPPVLTTYTVTGSLGTCTDTASATVIRISDRVCMAHPLVQGSNGPFTNGCATVEESDPLPPAGSEGNGCDTQDGWCRRRSLNNTLWFSFTAPASGLVSIDAPADFDNQVAVFSAASCQGLTEGQFSFLAGNDDFHGEEGHDAAAITSLEGLTPGETYWVMVDGGGTGETGTFHLILGEGALHRNPERELPNISLHPNPAGSSLQLSTVAGSKGALLLIRDATGRLCLTRTLEPGLQQQSYYIPLGGIEPGFHILSIHRSSGIQHVKFIKD